MLVLDKLPDVAAERVAAVDEVVGNDLIIHLIIILIEVLRRFAERVALFSLTNHSDSDSRQLHPSGRHYQRSDTNVMVVISKFLKPSRSICSDTGLFVAILVVLSRYQIFLVGPRS